MTKIAELQDKGAVVAWSPIGEYADVIALGSKVRFLLLLLLLTYLFALSSRVSAVDSSLMRGYSKCGC